MFYLAEITVITEEVEHEDESLPETTETATAQVTITKKVEEIEQKKATMMITEVSDEDTVEEETGFHRQPIVEMPKDIRVVPIHTETSVTFEEVPGEECPENLCSVPYDL